MTQPGAPPPSARTSRPRLAEHVAVRRHLVDGQPRVVLHDTRSGRVAIVGEREWALLRAADGTRDVEGILLAAARAGYGAGPAQLGPFLAELESADMLAYGGHSVADESTTRAAAAGDGVAARTARPDAALDPLSGFRLVCDGRGTCCRIYPTIVFSPLEAARARSVCPNALEDGWDEDRAFTPDRGSTYRLADGREQGRCVTMVDGRCAYLTADRWCALEQAGGSHAKPLGCRLFPASFVDDGEAIRVSVAPECACVFASVGRAVGEPLVPAGATAGRDLDAAVFVRQLPTSIPVTTGQRVERSHYVRWSRRVARHWGAQVEAWVGAASGRAAPVPRPADAVAALWSVADAVEDAALDWPTTRAALGSPQPVDWTQLAPAIRSLNDRLVQRLPRDVAWRGANDPGRQLMESLQQACGAALSEAASPPTCAAPPAGRGPSPGPGLPVSVLEAFYLHALVHGHQLLEQLPLVLALRERAVRLVLARSLTAWLARQRCLELAEPALAFPLALVEALLRGHGLAAF